MSIITLTEQGSAPSTPASSMTKVYVGSDGLLRSVDDAGTVTVYSRCKACPRCYLRGPKTSGTSAGTSTSGSWYAATINTIVHDPDSLVTLC